MIYQYDVNVELLRVSVISSNIHIFIDQPYLTKRFCRMNSLRLDLSRIMRLEREGEKRREHVKRENYLSSLIIAMIVVDDPLMKYRLSDVREMKK